MAARMIKLSSNISSLRAQRELGQATSALAKTFERLASGQRINRASDDVAGVAILESLKADSRVYGQAVRNVNDGLSLLTIADATVSQLSEILMRMRELSTQAANGSLGSRQRTVLNEEAQQLRDEFFRITRETEFNGRGLFDGSLSDGLRVQAGYGLEGSVQSTLGSGLGTGGLTVSGAYLTESGSSICKSNEVMLGDLNGDGIQDMVTAGYATDATTQGVADVFLGRGDGTFNAKTSYVTATGSGPSHTYAMDLGDVNGDGVLDLVTAGDAWSGSGQGQVSILLGRGDGTFGSRVTYATESGSAMGYSAAVKLGDVNGDGLQDIVTAGMASSGLQQGQASVLLGRGDGTFGTKVTYGMETGTGNSYSYALALDDVNADGILDLVTAGFNNNGTSQGQASVRLGRGDGTFGAKATYATQIGSASASTADIALADMNGDGILDLVAGGAANNGTNQGEIALLFGRGDGTFAGKVTFAGETGSSWGSTQAVKAADLNGDGSLDLITAGRFSNGSARGSGSIFLGRGDGTFGSKATFATETGGTSGGSYAACLGDVNGDGLFDLVTAGYTSSGTAQGGATVFTGVACEGIAPILPFSLSTMASAKEAMAIFDNKLNKLSAARGQIGGFQSRLQTTANLLPVVRENLEAAAGRIRDVDVAEESANMVRNQILQQASAAMLAQANQQPALVLELLN